MNLSPYRLMDDETLWRATEELERVTSRPDFESVAQPHRSGYVDALDAARAEVERRAT